MEWAEAAERVAFSAGLKPDEFLDMQPHEFYKYLDCKTQAMKNEDMRRAYFTSWILAPHVKEPPTPQVIYEGLWVTAEEKRNQQKVDYEILKKEFGVK